jgi:flagellar protein FliJ
MPRQFVFRLAALLTHRAQIEKEKQRKVGRIQQEINALLRQVQETQARIVAEDRSLSAGELLGRLDMLYIAYEKKYVGNLHVRILLALQKKAELDRTLAAARAELLEAARARKVIEKLREKQFARWRLEQDRKEAAIMDEIGTQLTIRQRGEEWGAAAESTGHSAGVVA